MNRIVTIKSLIFAMALLLSCTAKRTNFNPEKELDYCLAQIHKAMPKIENYHQFPRDIMPGDKYWTCGGYRGWTSGFWPGVLWYAYDYSGDKKLKAEADSFSVSLLPLSQKKAATHDVGFMVFLQLRKWLYGNKKARLQKGHHCHSRFAGETFQPGCWYHPFLAGNGKTNELAT